VPFEGAGAISYTVKDDGAFGEKVEEEIENSLIEYAESNNLIPIVLNSFFNSCCNLYSFFSS
jgi:hypothetical protein